MKITAIIPDWLQQRIYDLLVRWGMDDDEDQVVQESVDAAFHADLVWLLQKHLDRLDLEVMTDAEGQNDVQETEAHLKKKALKKAIRPVAKDTKNEIKADVPKVTGALKFSLDYKIISKKGSAAAVIGVKSKYSRTVKGKLKIPNLYALKVNLKSGFLERHINQQTVNKLQDKVAEVIVEMLNK